MPPDPLGEALHLIGDPAARPEIEGAVAAFRAAERLRRDGPAMVARLEAVAAAAALVAEAAGDPGVLDAIDPVLGTMPTTDPEALAVATAVELDPAVVADFATLARTARQRLEAAMGGPSARWRLLMRLAVLWQSRGHRLGSGPDGRFHRFARAVGDAAGVEITHYAIRQVCERRRDSEDRSHTATARVAA